MILPNVLFKQIVTKLKLEVSELEKNKLYINNLLNQATILRNSENIYSSKNSIFKNKFSVNNVSENKSFLVMYIISISFLKANTIVHVSDIKGNMKLFYTAGSVNLSGKQKAQRGIAISRLISLLTQKATFIGKKPTAVHLLNVRAHKALIINKLKRNFFVQVIRSFNHSPYNGCRKKKVRRKKYSKKIRK